MRWQTLHSIYKMGVFGITPFIAIKLQKLAAELKTPSVDCAHHTYLLQFPNFFSYITVTNVQRYCSLLYGVTAIVIYACSRPTVRLYCYEHISFYVILRMV